MFCSHCGKEVTVGARFCPNCGAAIESQPTPTEERSKSPTVGQTETPINKVAESSGQPSKGKKGIPKPLGVIAVALVLFIGFGAVLNLFGNDDKPDSSPGKSQIQPDESQSIQNAEISYREYNPTDFGWKHTLLRTIAEKDQQTVLKIYNMEGEEGGQNAGLLFRTLFVDLEGNSGFNLTYIDTIGTEKILGTKQFYYKVEVEDIEIFRANVEWWTLGDHKVDASSWSKDDEIYLQCDFFPPEKQKVQFYFRFKNYSLAEHQETDINTVEAPVIVPNETEPSAEVTTPDDFWIGHWIGLDEGVEMNVASTDGGYDVLISLRYSANDGTEFRLTGEDQIGVLNCEGEEWSIHYADNGEPIETLVGNCFGLLIENSSGESGYSTRYEWSSGDNVLRFVKWGEPLPEWYVREDRDFVTIQSAHK